MAALIGNPMLLTSAPSGDDAYEIEKSLRFSEDDDAYLVQSAPGTSGNRRTWTLNFWFKRTTTGGQGSSDYIFGCGPDANNTLYVYMDSTTLRVYSAEGGTNDTSMTTTQVFRDPGAWQMHTLAINTTLITESDRLKYYINGSRITDWSNANYPSLNAELQVNKDVNHYIGRTHDATTDPLLDAYLADVHFIDGLALSPAAFGEFDSNTGVWNPKAFSIPQINDGTVWSTPSYWSGTEKSDAPYDYGFDGHTGSSSSGTTATIAKIDNSSTSGWYNYTFTPPNPIKFVDRVEVHGSLTSVRWSINGEPWTTGTSNGIWDTIATGGGTITTIDIEADTNYPEWRGIRIDGVILLDGVTDPTTRNNPNDGTVWSTGASWLTGTASNVFNGDDSNGAVFDTTYRTITSSDIVVGTKIRIKTNSGSGTETVKDGDGNEYALDIQTGSSWRTLWNANSQSGTQYTGTLKGPVQIKRSVGSSYCYGIEVDDHILIDNTKDNSFHLKFNNATSVGALGLSSIPINVNNPDKAGPILQTTDTSSGRTVTSGTNTDSASSNLLFAMPGNGSNNGTSFSDYSATIKGSGSNSSLTATGAVTKTDQSRFYGSSTYIPSDGDGSTSSQQSKYITIGTPFQVGTSDFTVEAWVRPERHDCWPWLFYRADSSAIFTFGFKDTGSSKFHTILGGTQSVGNSTASIIYDSGNPKCLVNQWSHIAFVRKSGVIYCYVNGIKSTDTLSIAYNSLNLKYVGMTGFGDTDGEKYYGVDGHIADIRAYNSAKYDGAFNPNAPKYWKPNNLNAAGVPGHTGAWNTGFKKDSRTSWSSASDWTPSSGDTVTTNGNNTVLYIDRESLGDAFSITIEDTGGANDIYMAESDDGSTWTATYNNQNKIILTESSSTYISTSGTTTDVTSSIKRYLRPEGAGAGHVTMTITGTAFGEPTTQTDSLTDTPTNYGTDTGVGGEVRGNYCTINPLSGTSSNIAFSQGNLEWSHTHVGNRSITGCTFLLNKGTGKYYFEHEATGDKCGVGIQQASDISEMASSGHTIAQSGIGGGINFFEPVFSGSWGGTAPSGQHTNGSILGVAIDTDNSKIWFYKDGVIMHSGGNPATGANGKTIDDNGWPYVPTFSDASTQGTASGIFNFGQRAFKYTAPSGFKCLCTQNLPDTFSGDALNNPSKYFDIKLYTGDDTTDGSMKIKSSFGPDLAWLKARASGYDHRIFDRIRGQGSLVANKSDAEYSDAWSSLTTFDSDGISIEETDESYNKLGDTYVAWLWDAGTAAATVNTDGTIDPSNSWVNTDAGFNILKYTGTGTDNQTIGHNLSAKPDFMLFRRIENANNWIVYHKDLTANNVLYLNTGDAQVDYANIFEDTEPTNNLITIGSDSMVNAGASDTYMAYLWTSISGYSAFGKYVGNGSSSGPFVYTGFKPRWLMIRQVSGNSWTMVDTVRDRTNTTTGQVYADTYAAEATGTGTRDRDILANGFRPTGTSAEQNADTETYVYAAFAEHPFKLSRAH